MATRGSQAKADITQKILEHFPGSFVYEKEIRIPYIEDGIEGQIKLTLTAAKTMVAGGADVAMPGESATERLESKPVEISENVPQEPTAEEKERLTTLLNKLGL